jgi:CHAD domain-containing protein
MARAPDVQSISDMKEQISFKFPDELTREEIEVALAEAYPLAVEGPVTAPWCIYDTFDWRLFNRSYMLRRSGNVFTLTPLAGGTSLHHDVGSRQPVFAWDFPQGDLRTALGPMLRERALLPLTKVYVEETTYRLLNDDQKTVARFVCFQVQTGPQSAESIPATYGVVRPLRGYAKHARRLMKHLAFGELVDSIEQAIFDSALLAAGQTAASYSSRLDLALDPAMRADQAARAIFLRLLETMRANEAGIKADIDIEFLHDFRIAVRRTRSALSQIKGVFPRQVTKHFRQEFRTLGKLTNDLRDLDVYLLAEAKYRAMLPEAMQDDIVPLFDYLRAHRAEALASVLAGLESEAYAGMLNEWEAFLLGAAADESASNAAMPIIELARKRIRRQYRRIVRDGRYILKHTEDELLHALRLECKKLRYLLEFFDSLFPRKDMARLIKQLKRLQDNLGEFTDLTVQQAYLLSVAEALDIGQAEARRALVATGFLVETMARRQQEVKADFAGTFTRFASPSHQKQFHQLFGSRKRKRKS